MAGEGDWSEEMPLPQSGLMWPWLSAAFVMFALGMFLLAPDRDAAIKPSRTPRAGSPVFPAPPSSPRPVGPLQFYIVDSATSSFARVASEFGKQLSRQTRGHLNIELHPSGGPEKLDELKIIEKVRTGEAQLAIVTSSPLSNLAGDLELLDLPFLFHTPEEADRIFLGPLGAKLLTGLEAKNMVGLGTFEVGFRIFSSTKPLPTMADFNHQRVRVMQSALAISMIQRLGCEAVPSPVDKIYDMVKNGYIDAADRTYPTFWDFKLYEVQKFITESRHSYTLKVLIMNAEAYAQLSPEEKKLISALVHELEGKQRALQREEDREVKEKCRKHGIEIFELSERERRNFLQACQPLYEEFVKLHGPELLEEVRAALGPASGASNSPE